MQAGSIHFFFENISFRISNRSRVTAWLLQIFKKEKKKAGNISFIFCSDDFLHELNKKYLGHDTFTDIITFDNSEKIIPEEKSVSGDIYISIDRVKENAANLQMSFKSELHRVMAHGILHLCGFKDKSSSDKKQMRAKEDFYLNLLS